MTATDRPDLSTCLEHLLVQKEFVGTLGLGDIAQFRLIGVRPITNPIGRVLFGWSS